MRIYHETLHGAVDHAIEEYKGIIQLDETWRDHVFDSMAYETTQSKLLPGIKMVGNGKGKACNLYVGLYRMPSGIYELTAYCTL